MVAVEFIHTFYGNVYYQENFCRKACAVRKDVGKRAINRKAYNTDYN